MEMLFVIIAVLAAAWFLGFVKSIRTIAETANTEVQAYNVIHKNKTAKKLADLEIDADTWAKAKDAIAKARELTLD